ncbi:short-chain dehydrogenase [Aspergillus nomiae NRRL 13137]|uniref:Short-chain dehydrogenase n=1 Tax=Aspergillus nomiae NRRL (strain ATCC 15546 / NRRL 13137 / CBS 260.88 / M93) TaxID=1509407 RepID=A0A0L1IP70_ASPN3|nr:short-chain dehydrogenase [Aspergillus nomiae NRRL 13137]KNG81346.1 short-chain dehydrogenase [Aspergillus nomiae NRRL 13137]
MEYCKRIWPQIFPAQAALTSATLPSQVGRVVIITGSTAGIGLALTRIYYDAGATVYMAARNETKAHAAIQAITTTSTSQAPGVIKFLAIDLSDLRTIQPFVTAFLSQESRLDVLHNNAGVACVPLSQRTAQGLEPHMGTNCVAPYLLTSLLSDILVCTAAAPDTVPNSVRVIWSSSLLVDTSAPSEGVPPEELENPSEDAIRNYTISKTGNWFLADRFAKRFTSASVGASDSLASAKRVVSITANPATVRTGIYDNAPQIAIWLTMPFFATVEDGAHTLLWAGCSEDITVRDGGRYVIPFGQWHPNPRADLLEAMAGGYAQQFEAWAEKVTQEFR